MSIDSKASKPRKRPGRRTNAELSEARIAAAKAAQYEAQEAKRARLVQVDTFVVLMGWLIGVAVAFTTSAIISFNGITSVAPLVGLTFAWMSMLFFFFVEAMYILFLIAYLVLDSRGSKTGGSLFGMWFFAGVAILANAYHTFEFHKWAFTDPASWAGVVLSVTAPIAILSISKLASNLVFAKAIRL